MTTTSTKRRDLRGFTLVELLIVVAMIGVLAAIAIVGYRKYLTSAHASEAKAVMQSARGAQESFRAESLTYLNCKTDGSWGGNPDYAELAPSTTVGPLQHLTDNACWKRLHVTTDGPVRFRYAMLAGLPTGPTSTPGDPPLMTNPPDIDAAIASFAEPWFVVFAEADLDGDAGGACTGGTCTSAITTSFAGDIYMENEGE